MSDTLAKVAVGIAALFFLPALIAGGGFIVAAGLAIGTLVALLGGREGLEIIKNRELGAKAGQRRAEARDMVTGNPNDDEWGRK